MEIVLWLICILLVIVIGLQKGRIEQLKDLRALYEKQFLQYRDSNEGLVKIIARKDEKIKKKEGIIKFLGDRNIYLESKAGNVPWVYEDQSEVLKDSKVRAAHNMFLNVLQSSKEVGNG